MYNEFMMLFLLLVIVGLCFHAGYKWAFTKVIDSTLMALEEDRIIRLIELPNGDTEIYSGTKFYKK
jgi:hypothetical protein|tara:strand:+ start:3148 stop:3345 length:198 start_codon:yes stop_codon:yes gene_type:complete